MAVEGISHVRHTPQHTLSGHTVHWYAGQYTLMYSQSSLIHTLCWYSYTQCGCLHFPTVSRMEIRVIAVGLFKFRVHMCCSYIDMAHPQEVKQKAIEMCLRTHLLIVAKMLFSVNTFHYNYVYT